MLHKVKRGFVGSPIDFFGAFTSGLCAVHCLALPLLFSVGVFGGTTFVRHDSLETVVMIVSMILGSIAAIRGFNKHRSVRVISAMIIGMLLLLVGWLITGTFGHIVMALGGFLVAVSHFSNIKLGVLPQFG